MTLRYALTSLTHGLPGGLSSVALALLITLIAPCAHAQLGGTPDQQALQLYEQGSAAYTEGRYEDSIEAFSAAYRLSPRPLLLYNLANAYERVGRYQEAAQMLEGFLPNAPADERATIETRITNLRARPNARRGGGGGGDDALLAAGIGIGAGGVGLIGMGIVFAVLTLDARDQVSGVCSETSDGRLFCMEGADGPISDGETFALLADIGLIGGGVVAAAGIALIIVGAVSGGGESSGESALVVPDIRVGTNGASVGVRGRF